MRFSEGGIAALVLAMLAAPVTPKHAGSFTVIGFGNPVVVGREDPIISPGTASARKHVSFVNRFYPNLNMTLEIYFQECIL